MKALRILSISNTPLDPARGSGYVVTGFADGLRARGHTVELLGPPAFELFYGARLGIRYRQALGALLLALRSTRRQPYDVVELWGAENWLAALALVRVPRRNFLVVARSNGLEPHAALRMAELGRAAGTRFYQADLSRAFSRGFRAVDALVTVSEFDRQFALSRGYAGGRVLAIPNPLADAYLGLDFETERGPQIGFVGSWLPIKGIDLIRGTLPGVLREFEAWRLELIGVGDAFRSEAQFPPDVSPRVGARAFADRCLELRELYRQMAILILPSVYEGFGLVATEAMACGVALVATRVGFASGLCDGREALLLSEPTSARLAEALRRLILDEGLRWTSAVEGLESAYAHWLSALRASRRAS